MNYSFLKKVKITDIKEGDLFFVELTDKYSNKYQVRPLDQYKLLSISNGVYEVEGTIDNYIDEYKEDEFPGIYVIEVNLSQSTEHRDSSNLELSGKSTEHRDSSSSKQVSSQSTERWNPIRYKAHRFIPSFIRTLTVDELVLGQEVLYNMMSWDKGLTSYPFIVKDITEDYISLDDETIEIKVPRNDNRLFIYNV